MGGSLDDARACVYVCVLCVCMCVRACILSAAAATPLEDLEISAVAVAVT